MPHLAYLAAVTVLGLVVVVQEIELRQMVPLPADVVEASYRQTTGGRGSRSVTLATFDYEVAGVRYRWSGDPDVDNWRRITSDPRGRALYAKRFQLNTVAFDPPVKVTAYVDHRDPAHARLGNARPELSYTVFLITALIAF